MARSLAVMETDRSHLTALEIGLSHEKVRLAVARKPGERELRAVWVRQYEKEIAGERARLGLGAEMSLDDILISDDELLAELMA